MMVRESEVMLLEEASTEEIATRKPHKSIRCNFWQQY